MVGILYKITNDIDNKVYIGKTYTDVETRMKRHIQDCFREENGVYKYDYKFYRAMRKYGANNFRFSILGTYESGELETAEIGAIKEYNSYHNGYNSTLGGDGSKVKEYDTDLIRDLYESGETRAYICRKTGISSRELNGLLTNLGLDIPKLKAIIVEQMDKSGKTLNIFNSKSEDHDWLVKNYKANMKRCTSYYYIKKACVNNSIAFGFKWKVVGECDAKKPEQSNADIVIRIFMENEDNIPIAEFTSATAACNWLVDSGIIEKSKIHTAKSHVCRLEKQRLYGFYWVVTRDI